MARASEPADDGRIIAEFMKNSRELIRVRLSAFKGRELIDIRTWYTGEDGEWKPSSKGVAFNSELFGELRTAIDKLAEELEAG
jgi:hypothetical protein